jgi:thioredoxin 1
MGATAYIQDQAEFDNLLATSEVLVVDYTASWCGPCKLIAPLIDDLADTYGDRATVMKLDIDAHKEIAKKFEVKSIPVVMFFKQGEVVEKLLGAKPYEDYVSAIERHL